jgi:tRNA pseudouridine38-40 synthase
VRQTGVAGPGTEARIAVASRTDRGVSARANALTLESPLAGAALLRALNGIAPEIFFAAAAPVAPDFRVRSPLHRTYRYFQAPGDHRISSWRDGARLFVGDVDVRSFGRAIPSGAPAVRTLDAVRVRPEGRGLVLELTGRSFVWGMVRKIVAALRELDAGRLTLERLSLAVQGKVRLTLPMAEPEPLVLWDVRYPVTWQFVTSGPNRNQVARAAELSESLWTRARVLEALARPSPRVPSARASGPR